MALVLSRRRGEVICIGPDITVTVIGVDHRGEVRLAVNAPKSVTVHRLEVADRIRAEQLFNSTRSNGNGQ